MIFSGYLARMLWFPWPLNLMRLSRVNIGAHYYYILVVFPRDLFTGGFLSKNVSMLGLGDIVIPGIFIALLLRFDARLVNQYPSGDIFIDDFMMF